MRKISTKVFSLALSMVLLTCISLSSLCIIQIVKNSNSKSVVQLKAISNQDTSEVDKVLTSVEDKVSNVVYAININMDTESILSKNMDYFHVFEEQINKQAIDQLGKISGLLSAYVRYDPQLTYGTSGLFYTQDSNGKMTTTVPTDLLQYDKSDKEHVGWFYEPLENAKATWMEPYYNANLEKTIISYVIPFYVGNTGFGIVGIDFDFDYILDIINKNNTYTSGHISMLGNNYNFIYHPEYENGELLTDIEDGTYKDLKEKMDKETDGYYKSKVSGKTVSIGYATMDNGWKICIVPTSKEINSALYETIKSSIIIILIILALTVVISLFMGNKITKPITELTLVANSLADGNLDSKIDIKSKDEVGDLANALKLLTLRLNKYIIYIEEISSSLNKLGKGNLIIELDNDYNGEFSVIKDALLDTAATFRKTIGEIIKMSSQLAASSSQISNSSQLLAGGAVEQASSLEELTETIHKISDNVIINSGTAKDAAKYVENLGNTAQESRNKMHELTDAIKEISDKSNEINKINKTIEDIAFQTNILALNASVEAARAGAVGKGFAVVAEEVRNLAAKSSDAAKDTVSLIGETINAVENGSKIATETRTSMREVINGVTKSIQLINHIAEESNLQSESLSQVIDELEQVNSIVQTNSATAQESSAVSEELFSQASMLDNISKQFDIGDQMDVTEDTNKESALFV